MSALLLQPAAIHIWQPFDSAALSLMLPMPPPPLNKKNAATTAITMMAIRIITTTSTGRESPFLALRILDMNIEYIKCYIKLKTKTQKYAEH